MAGQALGFPSLKGIMNRFLFTVERLAVSFSEPFGPSSQPVSIGSDDLERLNNELERLKQRIERIRASLREAEERDVGDEAMKLWLTELRELECDAEDILEEFEHEQHRTTRLQDFWLELRPASYGKRKREENLLCTSYLERLPSKISKIRDRYSDITDDRLALRLRRSDGEPRPDRNPRPPTSSLITGRLYGREKEMKEVIGMLESDASRGNKVFSVVPVVGMPGVGKTSLVQCVFAALKERKRFDVNVWIHASQDLDVKQLTRSIIEGVTSTKCSSFQELDMLQSILKEKIEGKRFLLVLDDVWNESREVWERLSAPLNFGARGSKIIITTRNANAALSMGVMSAYHLSCLPDHDCWMIFKEHVFGCRNQNADPKLVRIGKEIIVKCRGLPLAAKVLGGLLSSKTDEKQWEDVLQDNLWNELGDEVLPILRLSYDHLPAHLKQCFAYCSLFPKGYLFQRSQLVRLWMAQGFIEPDAASRPKDIGVKYFDQLVERSFLQPSPFKDLSEERYVMHDLLHELAQSVSGNECSRVEDHELCEVDYKKTRHLSLVPQESHAVNTIEFKSFDGHYLRSLLFIAGLDYAHDKILFHVKIPGNMLMSLECLRALDLSNTNIEELPFSIGRVIHLRYLSLKNTQIRQLPESICSLFKLQALDLKYCKYLEKIPQGAKHLFNLRHLELPSLQDIHIPFVIGALTCLQTLSVFIVGSDSTSCTLTELQNLVELSDLHISGLAKVVDAHAANLKEKQKLRKLTLQWLSLNGMDQESDENAAYEVLEGLQPHSNLEVLAIIAYRGSRFPGWMADQSFSKLVTVTLNGCERCEELPPLGQLPCLKHLNVQLMARIQHVRHEFCSSMNGIRKGFPSLETLEFSEMPEWREWCGVEDGDFPRLRSLTINCCHKLKTLPRFNSLAKLGIHYCNQLHDIPVFSALKFMKIEGLPMLKDLPSLSHLSAIETLEIACCEQLSLNGNLQLLASLRCLKLTKCPCPMLHLSSDVKLLPSALKVVDIHRGCPLLSQWNPCGFEEYNISQESRKLVRCEELNWNQQEDDNLVQIQHSIMHKDLKQVAKGRNDNSGFIV